MCLLRFNNEPLEAKMTWKRYAVNTWYSLAAFGLFDMAVQAFTNKEVKPIHVVLGFIFG